MASFFEKLIGGQTEEQEEKKVIRKPVKKTVKPEEEVEEEKEVKKQVRKLKPEPKPEPEIKDEEEIEEVEEEEEAEEAAEKLKKPIQIQAKTKTETKEPESQKDWPLEEGQLAIDVYQNQEEIVVQSTIGGVKPNDLEITIENGMVHIKGRRQKTETVEKDNYFIQECHWGAFSRQLVLPSEVDSSRAEAILKDGVLTIKIPRIQREKITKLKIKE